MYEFYIFKEVYVVCWTSRLRDINTLLLPFHNIKGLIVKPYRVCQFRLPFGGIAGIMVPYTSSPLRISENTF